MESSVVARKNDPNYAQFSVYLPRPLVKRVKAVALELEVNLTELAEEALTQWVESKEKGNDSKQLE